jgi:glyoxylase-like metal-dependent hydrolase (beta-lactamase superfamily II)
VKVGALAVEPVYDGWGREPGHEILRLPGESDPWASCGHYLDGAGNLPLTFGGFLIRAGDRMVLVDAGLGAINNDKLHGGQFLESLRQRGVTPAEVTDVVFTHLHFDHVGWATRKGEIVFPNATYRVHRADWDWFVDSAGADPGAVRKLAPLTGRLEAFEADTTVLPGLDARHVPGHTPGSMIYVLSSGHDRVVLLGDVMHSPAEVTDPAWESVWDVDPAAAKRVRTTLIGAAADRPDVLAAAHFAFGRVVTVDDRHEFRFLETPGE